MGINAINVYNYFTGSHKKWIFLDYGSGFSIEYKCKILLNFAHVFEENDIDSRRQYLVHYI